MLFSKPGIFHHLHALKELVDTETIACAENTTYNIHVPYGKMNTYSFKACMFGTLKTFCHFTLENTKAGLFLELILV